MASRVSEAPTATAYTLEFVVANLPEGARDMLEIGCGEGELAGRLAADGFRVVAIDCEAACVEAARSRGADARLGEWPLPMGERFDAVLFTRSLHHVHDLDGGIAAARAVLRAGGAVIVEDFRIEGGSERSIIWFKSVARTLLAAGALREGVELDHVLAKIDLSGNEHELHASTAIGAALSGFAHVAESDSACYFRYLEPEFAARETASAGLLRHELELIAAGCIDPLGKRWVARD